jgi:20S proteasome alpha/beta subunit
MTLIICLLGKDAIVVASDSRASFEDEKSTAENQKLITHDDYNTKIHLIDNVAICGAGTTHTKMFVDAIKERGEGGATNIANRMTEVASKFPLFDLPNEHFTKVNPDFVRQKLELSIVGYDAVKEDLKEPRIYTMNSLYRFLITGCYFDSFSISGVHAYARCLLDLLYTRNMEAEVLEHLAVYVITKTGQHDCRVGGQVQMVTIPQNSDATVHEDKSIERIKRKNEVKTRKFKQIFK